MRADRRRDALRLLLQAAAVTRPDDLPLLVRQLGQVVGASETVIYVADYPQLLLSPMLHKVEDLSRDPLAVEGTVAGRAYAVTEPVISRNGAGVTLWLPLTDGAQRLGVLEMLFPRRDDISAGLQIECEHFASLIGALAVTRAAYGDALEASRRRLPMSTATELQRALLPPLTFSIPELVIAGALEPSYTVAGDIYDYAVNGAVAHIGIFDAIGHAMEATMLSAVAIAAYRNARRTGLDLVDTVRSVDRWISHQFESDKFVTGVLGELHIDTGVWRWITCGHPPALLLRGGRVVKILNEPINLPLGMLADEPVEIADERLEPADRLILHSDGVTESRDDAGHFFGADRLADFVSRQAAAGLPAAETLRRLMQAILSSRWPAPRRRDRRPLGMARPAHVNVANPRRDAVFDVMSARPLSPSKNTDPAT